MGLFGFIACLIITFAYIPQCIAIYKTKNVKGLNLKTFGAILIGMIFWITHALIIGDIPLLLSSIASLIQNSYIVYAIFKYK